jgi:hypothetical protein
VTFASGILSFQVNSGKGGKFQVQYSTDLASSLWHDLGEPTAATGETLVISDSIASSQHRFYRVAEVE